MSPKDFAVNFLITKDRRDEFLFNLERLLELKDPKKLLETIQKNFLPEEAQFLKEKLKNSKDKNKTIKTLKEELLSIPVFKITLAFQPSPSFVIRLASLLKSKNLDFILYIEKSSSLLAGALVEYKGNFWDFSLKNFLEEKGEL